MPELDGCPQPLSTNSEHAHPILTWFDAGKIGLPGGEPSMTLSQPWSWQELDPIPQVSRPEVPCWSVRRIPTREADAMRKLTFGMNLSLNNA